MEYIFWVFSTAVIFRNVQVARTFNLIPFWSYRAVRDGDILLLVQDIMNVIAFVPIGILLCCSICQMKLWQVLLFGLVFSVGIEVSQFILFRGFAEFDDVFHNAMGCLLGHGALRSISRIKCNN